MMKSSKELTIWEIWCHYCKTLISMKLFKENLYPKDKKLLLLEGMKFFKNKMLLRASSIYLNSNLKWGILCLNSGVHFIAKFVISRIIIISVIKANQ